eukprot:TRINITY_DN2688_c0_g1_i2.p1 TRINITY_DN2688_c0_g1~~TRINITY_DN2688_c0_g1_i2.p1  ORF type:complete len:1290 (+),score=319.49 TRINITY_DN2688_c0_g1_i2:59-3871(+)
MAEGYGFAVALALVAAAGWYFGIWRRYAAMLREGAAPKKAPAAAPANPGARSVGSKACPREEAGAAPLLASPSPNPPPPPAAAAAAATATHVIDVEKEDEGDGGGAVEAPEREDVFPEYPRAVSWGGASSNASPPRRCSVDVLPRSADMTSSPWAPLPASSPFELELPEIHISAGDDAPRVLAAPMSPRRARAFTDGSPKARRTGSYRSGSSSPRRVSAAHSHNLDVPVSDVTIQVSTGDDTGTTVVTPDRTPLSPLTPDAAVRPVWRAASVRTWRDPGGHEADAPTHRRQRSFIKRKVTLVFPSDTDAEAAAAAPAVPIDDGESYASNDAAAPTSALLKHGTPTTSEASFAVSRTSTGTHRRLTAAMLALNEELSMLDSLEGDETTNTDGRTLPALSRPSTRPVTDGISENNGTCTTDRAGSYALRSVTSWSGVDGDEEGNAGAVGMNVSCDDDLLAISQDAALEEAVSVTSEEREEVPMSPSSSLKAATDGATKRKSRRGQFRGLRIPAPYPAPAAAGDLGNAAVISLPSTPATEPGWQRPRSLGGSCRPASHLRAPTSAQSYGAAARSSHGFEEAMVKSPAVSSHAHLYPASPACVLPGGGQGGTRAPSTSAHSLALSCDSRDPSPLLPAGARSRMVRDIPSTYTIQTHSPPATPLHTSPRARRRSSRSSRRMASNRTASFDIELTTSVNTGPLAGCPVPDGQPFAVQTVGSLESDATSETPPCRSQRLLPVSPRRSQRSSACSSSRHNGGGSSRRSSEACTFWERSSTPEAMAEMEAPPREEGEEDARSTPLSVSEETPLTLPGSFAARPPLVPGGAREEDGGGGGGGADGAPADAPSPSTKLDAELWLQWRGHQRALHEIKLLKGKLRAARRRLSRTTRYGHSRTPRRQGGTRSPPAISDTSAASSTRSQQPLNASRSTLSCSVACSVFSSRLSTAPTDGYDGLACPADAYIEPSELQQNYGVLGEGKFGRVTMCSYGPLGCEYVAVKQLHHAASHAQRTAFVTEVNSLLEIRGRCSILHAYGWSRNDAGDLLLITEYCAEGSLLDALRDRTAPYPGECLADVLLCIATGLAYLHSQGVVHGDVGARNVLLASARRAKLADIGLAVPDGGRLPWVAVPWASPELLQTNGVASCPVDVWAFGVLVWETLYHPYAEPYEWLGGDGPAHRRYVQDAVCSGDESRRLPMPRVLDPAAPYLWEAVARPCMQHAAGERPTFDAIIRTLRTHRGGQAPFKPPPPRAERRGSSASSSSLPPYHGCEDGQPITA